MKTEVCCLPRVSEPVAIFRRFFIPVCKFRGTEWEPVLHTACERGWRTSCAGVCTGSSEQLFPVCKGSFPTWQHQFPAEIWWAGLGFSCNAHEFTSVGKLEQLSHLMPDWGPFWAHSNLQQHHLVLRGCSLHGKQGGGEGLFGEKPGAKLSCFDTTGASYRFKSPLKPSTGCQSSENALHLVVTSKNVPLPGVAFRMQAVRDPPRDGMVLLCSSPPGNTSELPWEWSLEPWAEFDSASVSSGAYPPDRVGSFPQIPHLEPGTWTSSAEVNLNIHIPCCGFCGNISQDELSL